MAAIDQGNVVAELLDLVHAVGGDEYGLAFAAQGNVKADIELQPLSAINEIFDRLKQGKVAGRVVLDFVRPDQRPGRRVDRRALAAQIAAYDPGALAKIKQTLDGLPAQAGWREAMEYGQTVAAAIAARKSSSLTANQI